MPIFTFNGLYREVHQDIPKRPFIQVVVSLPRFDVIRPVQMLVDSGADITTLQPQDTLLMLDETQFSELGNQHVAQGIGGYGNFLSEDAAIGFLMTDGHICWIPITIDIAEPNSPLGIPSVLGNDVMRFAVTRLDAINSSIIIEFHLSAPIIT
jgi:hypothetical protein